MSQSTLGSGTVPASSDRLPAAQADANLHLTPKAKIVIPLVWRQEAVKNEDRPGRQSAMKVLAQQEGRLQNQMLEKDDGKFLSHKKTVRGRTDKKLRLDALFAEAKRRGGPLPCPDDKFSRAYLAHKHPDDYQDKPDWKHVRRPDNVWVDRPDGLAAFEYDYQAQVTLACENQHNNHSE